MLKLGLDSPRNAIWYDVAMLEGKCPKCGARYFGWALRFPRHQTCPGCGVGLEILEDGKRLSQGYSPFTAEKHSISIPHKVPSSDDKEK